MNIKLSPFPYFILFSALLPAPWIWFSLTIVKNVWITFLGYQLFICIIIPLSTMLRSRGIYDDWGVKPPFSGLLISSALGIFSGALILLVFHMLRASALDPEGVNLLLQGFGITPKNKTSFFLVMTLANATAEEFFWRGFVLGGFLNTMKKMKAVIVSAVLFMFHHIVTTTMLFPFGFAVLFSLFICMSGVFFGYWRLKTENLVSVVLIHLLADAGIIGVYIIYFL